MNLCPCGGRGDSSTRCACTPERIHRYREKLSRALLDRFDLALTVPRPRAPDLAGPAGERSSTVRGRALDARLRLREHVPARTTEADGFLTRAAERLPLSGRGHARVGRVAATIAALATSDEVLPEHVAEALSYRTPAEVVD